MLNRRRSRAVLFLDSLFKKKAITDEELWAIDGMLDTKTHDGIAMAIGILTARYGYVEVHPL